MAKKRNKKKIPTYQVDNYRNEEALLNEQTLRRLGNNFKGIEEHPKHRINSIINFVPKIKFKNSKQEEFHNLLVNKEVVACQGSAGCGKTYLAVYTALKLLVGDNDIFKIVLTKPSQQLKGEELGFIKGGVDEKIAPIMESYDGIFEEILGKHVFKSLVEEGIIIHKPLSFLRGQTLKNAIIIFDEVQMSTVHVCRTLMQRFGESSKMYLLGDEVQIERGKRENNPLTAIYKKFEKSNHTAFGTYKFGVEDIVRNPLITVFEKMFEEIENEQQVSMNKRIFDN